MEEVAVVEKREEKAVAVEEEEEEEDEEDEEEEEEEEEALGLSNRSVSVPRRRPSAPMERVQQNTAK